jgi:separase
MPCVTDSLTFLDASAAITLRRELVDAIEQKFPELDADDMVWPAAPGRSPMPPPTLQSTRTVDSDDVDEREHSSLDLKKYWQSVRDRYYSAYDLDQSVSTSQVDLLPVNWTVVSVSITEDKGTMFFSRQRPNKEPLIFCVPLERHGRKEEDTEEQFTYDDVMLQFKEILEESNVSARYAKDVPSGDRDAKAAWWANRVSLDKRMRELLENIEFCWLGAFKVFTTSVLGVYISNGAPCIDDPQRTGQDASGDSEQPPCTIR